MPISATNYDGSLNYNVAEMDDLCKPNLFDNADFRQGIVNQKGASSYSADAMAIDRWFINTKNNTMTIHDGYISQKFLASGGGSLIQNFALDGLDLTKHHTFTIKLKEQPKPISVTLTDYTTAGYTIIDKLTCAIRKQTSKIEFLLYQYGTGVTDKTFNIEYMKLEEGDVFTGMPVWNEAVETLKCKQWFQIIEYFKTIWTNQYETFVETIVLPVKMRKSPSSAIQEVDKYGIDSISINSSNMIRVDLAYKPNSSTGLGHRIGVKITLDAYDY